MAVFPTILKQFFQLEEHNSDVVTEVRAGVVTFFTSSYIIFVQLGRGFTVLPHSRWDATYFQYCGWYGVGVYILSTDQTILR
jgi:hypothetical protein